MEWRQFTILTDYRRGDRTCSCNTSCPGSIQYPLIQSSSIIFKDKVIHITPQCINIFILISIEFECALFILTIINISSSGNLIQNPVYWLFTPLTVFFFFFRAWHNMIWPHSIYSDSQRCSIMHGNSWEQCIIYALKQLREMLDD